MAGTQEKNKSGLSTGIRIAIAFGLAVVLTLFIGFFELYYSVSKVPSLTYLLAFRLYLPLLAVLLSFGGNCLIQYLSCNKVETLLQFGRSFIILVPLVLTQLILYFIPIMRWPIEGMFQLQGQPFQRTMSTAFYVFWAALYGQASLNSLAQICPK